MCTWMVRSGLAASLGLLLLAAPAAPAHAQCTTPAEARAVGAGLREALACRHREERKGVPLGCRSESPACAGTLVRDAVALVYGADGEPAAGFADARQRLRCQRRIGAASARFVGGLLKRLIRGEPALAAEARARRPLDALPDECLAAFAGAGGGAPAALGPEGAAALAAASVVDANAVRDALAAALATWARRAAAPAQPNFVLVVTDDQRADTTTPALMPKLVAGLAGRGVRFSSAFVSNPICCPSRASILTGQYAYHHGVLRNARGDPLDPTGNVWAFSDVSTLATWLDGAGYRTGLFGKYLNGYAQFSDEWAAAHGGMHYVPPGWDRWYAFHRGELANHGAWFVDEAGTRLASDPGSCRPPTLDDPCPEQPPDCPHNTDRIRDEAVRFIEESAARGERFFVYLATQSPHAPACPAARHRGARAGLAPHRPPSHDEGAPGRDGDGDKPRWVREQAPLGTEGVDALRVRQLESLLSVDDAVGAILQKLQETGQDANTVFVFTSDNGVLWGEHRHGQKSCPYEECLRVPFLLRAPGLVPRPRVERAPVLNIDIAPTFAALAGLDPSALSPRPDGLSLVRLLQGTQTSWRTDWLGEHWGVAPERPSENTEIPTWALVRGPRWKYVEYCTGETELYDLASDPFELSNLASLHGDVAASQAVRLRELHTAWPAIPFPCEAVAAEPEE